MQLPLPFLCPNCSTRLHGHGRDRQLYPARKRHRCPACKRVYVDNATKGRQTPQRFEQGDYWAVYLGVGHPYANSGGWQYEHRLRVMEALGRRLRSDEHVDHVNSNKRDNRVENLRVVLAPDHGRRHRGVGFVVLAEWREGRGFVEVGHGVNEEQPIPF